MKLMSNYHNYFLFTKIRNVKTPVRSHYDDAGIDLFLPEIDEKFKEDYKKLNPYSSFFKDDEIIIYPHCSVKIPSGIKVVVPKGYALFVCNRSGIASKSGLIFGAHVIDSSYRGEVIINLINVSDDIKSLKAGQKIVQVVLMPVALIDFIEVDNEVYSKVFENSERGEKGFGSTDL